MTRISAPRRAFRRAFTLIELLVVIAIIAILAAILFPVFAQAKNAALQTQCISNVKQFGIAFAMYQNDSEDRFPPFTINPGPNSLASGYRYNDIVNPYVKNGIAIEKDGTGKFSGIWRCPIAGKILNDTINTFAYNVYGLGGFSSSGLLDPSKVWGSEWEDFAGSAYNVPATMSALERPSQTYLIADGAQLMRAYVCMTAGGNGPDCIAVFGPHDIGKGGFKPKTAWGTFPAERDRLASGKKTVMVYTDSSSKVVNTQQFYPTTVTADNGAWKGGAKNYNGWTRTWKEN